MTIRPAMLVPLCPSSIDLMQYDLFLNCAVATSSKGCSECVVPYVLRLNEGEAQGKCILPNSCPTNKQLSSDLKKCYNYTCPSNTCMDCGQTECMVCGTNKTNCLACFDTSMYIKSGRCVSQSECKAHRLSETKMCYEST